ncbi:MAG: phage holin family protein [Verrucomicrobiae bacterium]|nr:phage holin family protein [Verrucomicrobiae bacterium]
MSLPPEDEPQEPLGGLTAPFRRLIEAATGFLSSKVELISIEWQEEKRRILELLVLAGVALLFGVLAFSLITFCVVAFFWETHRFLALLGLGALYLLISWALLVRLQRKAHLSTKVFEATLEELKKDTAWVKRHL